MNFRPISEMAKEWGVSVPTLYLWVHAGYLRRLTKDGKCLVDADFIPTGYFLVDIKDVAGKIGCSYTEAAALLRTHPKSKVIKNTIFMTRKDLSNILGAFVESNPTN